MTGSEMQNQGNSPLKGDSKENTSREPGSLPHWPARDAAERVIAFGKVLLFAVSFAVLLFILGPLVAVVSRGLHLSRSALSDLVPTLCSIGATFIMAKVDRKSFLSYGLGDRRAGRRFSNGSLWGFLLLTALLLGLRASGHYYFGSAAIHGAEILNFALLYVGVFLLVALFEETLTRGYALFTLSKCVGFWPAAIVLATLFAAAHLRNSGESIFGVVAAGLFGLVLSFSVLRSGSLWWAIGFHFMWDYSQSFIYGVPDSGVLLPGHLLNSRFIGPEWITGGTVGPEGSYFILLALIALTLVISLSFPARRGPFEDRAVHAL